MTILRRALGILTWRHLAWTVAIVVVWQSVARLGFMGNAFDRMNLASWLFDVRLELSFAVLYLVAVVVAEAASRTPAPMKGYLLAALAASAMVVVVRPVIPMDFPPIGGPESRPFYERTVRLLSTPSAVRRQKVMDATNTVVFFSLVVFAYAGMRRSRLAWRAVAEAELARSEAQRELAAARLGSAQAITEPRQVLDRLARIEAMYEEDCPRADAMMDELIDFLRAAIPRLRADIPEGSAP